jgi:hypothetical protein
MRFQVEAYNKGNVFMNLYGTNWDFTTEKQMTTMILIKKETKCAFCEEGSCCWTILPKYTWTGYFMFSSLL